MDINSPIEPSDVEFESTRDTNEEPEGRLLRNASFTSVAVFRDEDDEPDAKAFAQETERQDRPLCGSLWFIASMFFQPIDLFAMKYLFDKYPNIGAFQLIVARSAISVIVLLAYLNVRVYKVTVTQVKGKPKGALVFRCMQSSVAMILKTIITKYLSITLISIVYNMIPMFVIIIAWLTIHEKIDVIEIAMLGLTTIFLSAIVWNGHKKNDEQVDWDEILMYFLLFIQTVGTAAGTVALRTLKKFDETIILWYSYWCAIVISLPIVYIFSDGLAIFNYFNLLDWTIMTVTALAKMLMLWTKIKALQLQSSAKLQILSPVQTVITFVVQITLFHEPFTDFQYWMLALIGVLYFLEGIYIIFFQKKQRATKIKALPLEQKDPEDKDKPSQ